ncbi:single-stranded DNA-binding protein WHY2, mitochondrial-like [Phoenix dactylifera]|uniref:Single-stranded DNA-binding protein WHY2, mitochondrial-like n=1 Tax=Phoenix dactylifera TaxID=42345 RepID=A0A8B7CPU8_PHODC|nr:single-stranded DNA-binding protein WHY2, mitochondrial-like [Phoenix dactylifera]
MMKFSRFWLPRNQLASKFLPEKNSNIKEASWFSNYSSRFGISTARSDSIKHGNYSGKTYADFSIFKGKAALTVSPVLPTFSRLDSGSSKVDRRGVVLLKFMPAIGQRKYDPEKKQLFALSATEIGCLISLGPAESCEFFHDPSMKSSLEGQVKKTLSVSPVPNGEGYFFNLTVMNSVQKTNDRFSVPVAKAEFAVVRAAFSFILPYIMGWDQVVKPQLESVEGERPKQREMRPDPDFEWER